jgi:hypothetical protein
MKEKKPEEHQKLITVEHEGDKALRTSETNHH